MGDISTPLTSLNCKIEQGVDTLKSFIYLTNEYGVPSVSYMDDFISNFGHDIVTGQFRYSKLDGFWETVKDDCEKNKVQYKEVYGSLFYELVPKYLQVVTKGWSEEEKKDLISSEKDKLDLLKDFISNFDKYISEGLDMQEVYLENTPELIKKDENGEEYIDIKCKLPNKKYALGRLYKRRVIVIKGSNIGAFTDRKTCRESELRAFKVRRDNVQNDIAITNIEFNSTSAAATFVRGRESNGWTYWEDAQGRIIEWYRTNKNYKGAVVQSVAEAKIEPIKVVQNKIDVEPVKQVENTVKNEIVKIGYGACINVYLNNCKDLIKTDENTGDKYINVHTTLKGDRAYGRLYENGSLLLFKGSICKEPNGSILIEREGVRIQELYSKYTNNGLLNTDLLFTSMRLASHFVIGNSTYNGWSLWLNDNNDSISIYREPLKNHISTYKNPVTSYKIPRYRLKAQYCSNGSQSLLGRELRLDGKFFGLIIGDTQAKIDGKAYDLSIYIYKNKIDISRLSIFVAPFLAAYELAED